jgi:hypothetical protein
MQLEYSVKRRGNKEENERNEEDRRECAEEIK